MNEGCLYMSPVVCRLYLIVLSRKWVLFSWTLPWKSPIFHRRASRCCFYVSSHRRPCQQLSLLTFPPQAFRVEFLPFGERASEQLWRVSGREGHLCGAAQRRWPDAAGADDGPGGWRSEPLWEEDPEEVLQPVAKTPPAVLFTVRHTMNHFFVKIWEIQTWHSFLS